MRDARFEARTMTAKVYDHGKGNRPVGGHIGGQGRVGEDLPGDWNARGMRGRTAYGSDFGPDESVLEDPEGHSEIIRAREAPRTYEIKLSPGEGCS